MVKYVVVIGVLMLMGAIFVACSGDDGVEKESFLPQDIPSEHQGLSLEALKSKNSTPLYKELGDNIDIYKGKLVWFNGKIEREYEGSISGTYQTWMVVIP